MQIAIVINKDTKAVTKIQKPDGLSFIDVISIMGFCINQLSNAIRADAEKKKSELIKPTLTDINNVKNN